MQSACHVAAAVECPAAAMGFTGRTRHHYLHRPNYLRQRVHAERPTGGDRAGRLERRFDPLVIKRTADRECTPVVPRLPVTNIL